MCPIFRQQPAIPSPMNTQMASSVDSDDHSDASPWLRRLLRAPPVSSSPSPPTYIPPSKKQHASPSLGSKQKSTPSSSMTMPKGSTSIPQFKAKYSNQKGRISKAYGNYLFIILFQFIFLSKCSKLFTCNYSFHVHACNFFSVDILCLN